jgi:hypothetical protein
MELSLRCSTDNNEHLSKINHLFETFGLLSSAPRDIFYATFKASRRKHLESNRFPDALSHVLFVQKPANLYA